jgi:CBS domain-containing protein
MKTAQDFMIEIPVLKYNDQITKARQVLRDDRFREIYVVDAKDKLLGYLDITDGLRVTATKSNVTVEGFVKDAARGKPEDPIEKVAKTMREYHTDSAAIISPADQIIGAVLLADLFPVIISKNELHGIVSDVMSENVVSAGPADTVRKVFTMIVDSGFSAFPVVKKRKLVGIISRRDLISTRRMRSATARHAHTPIGDVMTKECVTIAPDEPVAAAAELLVKHDISLLPVTDGNVIVGIINRHDVLAALA